MKGGFGPWAYTTESAELQPFLYLSGTSAPKPAHPESVPARFGQVTGIKGDGAALFLCVPIGQQHIERKEVKRHLEAATIGRLVEHSIPAHGKKVHPLGQDEPKAHQMAEKVMLPLRYSLNLFQYYGSQCFYAHRVESKVVAVVTTNLLLHLFSLKLYGLLFNRSYAILFSCFFFRNTRAFIRKKVKLKELQ